MSDNFNDSQKVTEQKNANIENPTTLPASPNQANVSVGGEGIVFHKPTGEKKSKVWVNSIIYYGFLLFFAAFAGYGFSYLFSQLTNNPIDEVMPICFWFGPVSALLFALQRFYLGKRVETSFQYSSEDELSKQIGLACEKINYRQAAVGNDTGVWVTKNTGLMAGNFDPLNMKMKDGIATITGQKALLEKILADLGLQVIKSPI